MYKELETKLTNMLKGEFDYVKKHENDPNLRYNKLNDVFHLQQIILNFSELEPLIADYLNKKAEKNRFER